MKLASRNIGGGMILSEESQEYSEENIAYFEAALYAEMPDMICLQEAHVSQQTNQSKRISEAVGYEFFAVEQVSDSHLKEGESLSLGIISRYPIVSKQFHPLPNPNLPGVRNGKQVFSHDKGFLEIEILYHERTVRIVCLHMLPFQGFKKDILTDEFTHLRSRCEEIILSSTLPTIVAGDRNFQDIAVLMPHVFSAGYQEIIGDVSTKPTGKSIDKILVSPHWSCATSYVLPGKADHYLCIAEVELQKQ